MRAGNLDREITIEAVTETRTATGAISQSWATFATVWAERKDVRASEQFKANREMAERATVWRIRYLPGLTEKHRINDGTQTWDIDAIAELGRRDGLEVLAMRSGSSSLA